MDIIKMHCFWSNTVLVTDDLHKSCHALFVCFVFYILQWCLSGRPQGSGVTEVALPKVKAEHKLSLPLDIDRHPFTHYANTVLKVRYSFICLELEKHASFLPSFRSCTSYTIVTQVNLFNAFVTSVICFSLHQDGWCQPQGYPLQKPLTSLDPEDARTALEIYKLVSTMPENIDTYNNMCFALLF